jgi:hypothetical protein
LSASAQSGVNISLNSPKYCTLNPPGTTKCTDTGTVNSDLTGDIYVTMSYDTSHLSVSITCSALGVPQVGSNNCDPTTFQDNSLSMSATYIKSTCDKGTYTISFTAQQGNYYSYDTYTVYVHCPFLPA